MSVFSKDYADFYDTVYNEKNYRLECHMLKSIFSEFASCMPRSILDLGCGTGGHSILFAEDGFDVVGIDSSESMLSIAREKSASLNRTTSFLCQDIAALELGKTFDVAICMFAVLCYQRTNKQLARTLEAVSKHLRKDALFVFDFWYGPAVLTIQPETRVKVFEKDGHRLIRIAEPRNNTREQLTEVSYHLIETVQNLVTKDIQELHFMRYFFPLELEYFLEKAGLKLVHIGDWADYRHDVKSDTWNAIAIAKKV